MKGYCSLFIYRDGAMAESVTGADFILTNFK